MSDGTVPQNLPSLCRRLFSIGLFMPYCTNLFLNTHLAGKGQEHPHRKWALLLFSCSNWMNRLLFHLVCCTVKRLPIIFFPWWTLSLPGTQQATVPVLSHMAIYSSSHLPIYLPPLDHSPLFSHIDWIVNSRMIKNYSSGWVGMVWCTRTPFFSNYEC